MMFGKATRCVCVLPVKGMKAMPQTLARKFIALLAVLLLPLTAYAQTPAPPAEDEPELVEFDTA